MYASGLDLPPALISGEMHRFWPATFFAQQIKC
jgi:hypothetical protein